MGTKDKAWGEAGMGACLADYQEELLRGGQSLSSEIEDRYVRRWTAGTTGAVLAVRTALVVALHDFLAGRGLVNIDRVSLSPVTDPLAHDVESSPVISYRGMPYRTTHSMIYSKMLACMAPEVPGIFVDSPNIRLELPAPGGSRRGRYLIDFSQMDVEFKRKVRVGEAMYREEEETVSAVLEAERDRALDFFEDLLRFAVARVSERAGPALESLGVALAPPPKPFPRFFSDEAMARLGLAPAAEKDLEAALGAEAGSPFFWILGLYRENYDLVYPYRPGGPARGEGRGGPGASIPSRQVYNYDLCVSAPGGAGRPAFPAIEVLSGGLREWIPSVIAQRLVDNGVLPGPPRFDGEGNILNLGELGGYGPFLAATRLRDGRGLPLFPQTAGGGLGIERFLYAVLRGPAVGGIEDVTLFGKDPDAPGPFLF